jgi:transcriptional regulator with PAS, ATPase and Fis domain
MHEVHRVAPTRATVLLLGESGAGKSRFAHALHLESRAASGPFIEINCAAIPEPLLEAELFGAERGSYTGATDSRPGRFEAAHRGTLFLDEVGAMTLTAQSKLLRAIQTGEIERLGSSKTMRVDVRVVAATNVDLRAAVKLGTFREDLYYRLNVFPIVIPPLRERKDDIPIFLEHFLTHFTALHGRRLGGFTSQALHALLTYSWPGNIRELENVIERGVILAHDDAAIDVCHLFTSGESVDHDDHGLTLSQVGALTLVEPELLPVSSHQADASAPASARHATAALVAWAATMVKQESVSLGDIEAALVRAAVEHAGNVSRAAALLGLSRAQLDYRLKKMGRGARQDGGQSSQGAEEAPPEEVEGHK